MTNDQRGRAALQRAEAERLAATVRPPRPALAGMDRGALRARVEHLLGAAGGVAVHHRDLEAMTEVDLRSAVADLEALLDEAGA